MNGLASYILSVTAASILASIVKELAGQGTMGTLVKYLAGIFVAVSLLSPVAKLKLPDMGAWMADFSEAGNAAAAAGEEMAEEASREFIKAGVESYILDKAADYGAAISVDVALDETGVPESVTLRGRISPAVKGKLKLVISQELGIGKEHQYWIE